jgi:hypothetical protein
MNLPTKAGLSAAALIVFLSSCQTVHAQTDVTGTWRADDVGGGSWSVTLRMEAGRLTGRVSSCTSLSVEIDDAIIEGDSVRFRCTSLDGDRTVTLRGRIVGDRIAFTWQKEVRPGGRSQPGRANLLVGDANAWEMFGQSTPRQFTANRVKAGGTEHAAAVNLSARDIKIEGTVFVPPNAPRVRAVVVLLNSGTSWTGMGGWFYQDSGLRNLAEKLQVALFLPRFTTIARESVAGLLANARLGGAEGIFRLLELLAHESAHPELKDVPLLLWAHSRTGHFAASFAALHPQRTIALVRYHTAGSSLGGPQMSVLTQIPVLLMEAGSDIENQARPGFRGEPAESAWKAGRAAGAPWTFAVEPDAVHQNPEDLEAANALVLPWIAAVLRLRLSEPNHVLRTVNDMSGWLGEIDTGTATLASDFPGPRPEANWLPDEESVQGWRVVTRMRQ